MNIPDLGSVLVSLSEVFPLVVNLIFLLIALLGIWYGTSGLYALYGVAAGEHKFSNRPVTIDAAFGKLALAAAMIVAPVLLWRFANSFVLGGDITFSMFNYSATQRSSTCDGIRVAITYFFMALGALGNATEVPFAGCRGVCETETDAARSEARAAVQLISSSEAVAPASST